MAIDLNSILAQFKGLDAADIARWPAAPKWAVAFLAMAAIVGAGWYFYLDDKLTVLKTSEAKELKLKQDYEERLRKAVNLDALKIQKIQVSEYVTQMERQLPDKAEMDKLLSDVNYAGTSKGLVFELFRPGAVRADAYYAELPITMKVTGTYHKLASFASEIAALPRIVTLNNMNIVALPPAQANAAAAKAAAVPINATLLSLEATAKTFRYLDADEIAAAKKAKVVVKK